MGLERTLRPVYAFCVVCTGIAVGILLDVCGRALAVFLSGKAPTLANIASLPSRPYHAGAWVGSLIVLCLVLTYVVGRSIEFFWLENKKKKQMENDNA